MKHSTCISKLFAVFNRVLTPCLYCVPLFELIQGKAYPGISKLVPLWFQVIDNSFKTAFQQCSSNQQNCQKNVWEQCGKVNNLRTKIMAYDFRVDLWKALLVYSALPTRDRCIIGKFNQLIYKLVSQICIRIRMGTYNYLR